MKRVKAKRPQLKLKPGLKDTKKVNDLIINGEHEFKQEEQYFQLSANTSSKIDRQRGDFSRVVALDNIGAPQVDRFVYSSYDARPFNGRDINYVQTVAYDTVSKWAKVTFTIPDGYVFVFRKISGFIYDGAPPNPSLADVRLTVIINGAADPYNTLVPCFATAASSACLIKDVFVYYVLDEADVLQIEFYSPNGSGFNGHSIAATLSGNLLQKTGVPANFEIGFDTKPMTTFKPIDKKTMYKQPKKLKK